MHCLFLIQNVNGKIHTVQLSGRVTLSRIAWTIIRRHFFFSLYLIAIYNTISFLIINYKNDHQPIYVSPKEIICISAIREKCDTSRKLYFCVRVDTSSALWDKNTTIMSLVLNESIKTISIWN